MVLMYAVGKLVGHGVNDFFVRPELGVIVDLAQSQVDYVLGPSVTIDQFAVVARHGIMVIAHDGLTRRHTASFTTKFVFEAITTAAHLGNASDVETSPVDDARKNREYLQSIGF